MQMHANINTPIQISRSWLTHKHSNHNLWVSHNCVHLLRRLRCRLAEYGCWMPLRAVSKLSRSPGMGYLEGVFTHRT